MISAKYKFAIALSSIFLAAGFLVWVFFYLSTGVTQARDDVDGIREKISLLEAERESARRTQKIFETHEEDIKEIYKVFANKERPIEFIQALEEAGKASEVALSLELDQSNKEAGKLYFQITLDGFNRNLLRYVEMLGFLPYDVEIQNIGYQKSAGSPVNASKGPKGSSRLMLLLSVQAI